MQLKKLNKHESKSAVAGSILTYQIPVYGTIDDIFLRFTNAGVPSTLANILAGIGRVSLTINGEQVINTKLSRIYDIYALLGRQVVQPAAMGNVISLNLARLMYLSPANEDYFSLGDVGVSTVQLQINIEAEMEGITDIELITERRDVHQPIMSMLKVITYPQAMSAAGISTVDSLPRDPNEGYLSILVHNGGGVISDGEASINGTTIIDPISKQVMDYVANQRGAGALANYLNYYFADGSARALLPMSGINDLRLKTRFTTAPPAGEYELIAISMRGVPNAILNAFNA
ncbi:hypothetical protein FACS1894186_4310 [Alphaproteobacteria bacterium]|nr:hypothetical protein FACS1894186_4310 [Alphaproteobacteria bacterium]